MATTLRSEDEETLASSRVLGSVGAARASDEEETASVAKIRDELVDDSLISSTDQKRKCSLWR